MDKFTGSNGHIEIAKWIYSLNKKININTENETFKWACKNKQNELAKWLYSLNNIYTYML